MQGGRTLRLNKMLKVGEWPDGHGTLGTDEIQRHDNLDLHPISRALQHDAK